MLIFEWNRLLLSNMEKQYAVEEASCQSSPSTIQYGSSRSQDNQWDQFKSDKD